MKAFVTALFLCCFIQAISAQRGVVNIRQDDQISALLDVYKSANSETNYYTIQVGFGSYSRAETLKSQVEIDFPGWYSKIIFDSPTYRVHVGRFQTKLEAERVFQEVRKKYPESLLLSPDRK